MDATRRLILQKGVDNTSLADIARAVGISKGTLYYYYASKNDLIFALTEQYIDQITSDLLAWIESMKGENNPAEILTRVFETMLKAESRGRLRMYLILEAIVRNEELRQRFAEKYRSWRALIQQALCEVLDDPFDNTVLSHVILTTLDGFIIQSLLGVDQIPLDEIAQHLVGAEV